MIWLMRRLIMGGSGLERIYVMLVKISFMPVENGIRLFVSYIGFLLPFPGLL